MKVGMLLVVAALVIGVVLLGGSRPIRVPTRASRAPQGESVQPGGPSIPRTTLVIASRSITVVGTFAVARLSCQMGEAINLVCRGTLALETIGHGSATPPILLARGRFAIPNCCSAPSHLVRVPTTEAGRKRVSRARRIVSAIATLDLGEVSAVRRVAWTSGTFR